MKISKWWVPFMVALLIAAVVAGCSDNKKNDSGSHVTANETPSGSPNATSDNKGQSDQEQLPANLNEAEFPIVKEPITLAMMGAKTANQLVWEEMAFFQEMENLTQIRFEFDTPAAENYREKLNLRFASGNLPDVLFGANLLPENEILFGSQGQLIPLEGLIEEYAPNIRKLLDDNPDIRSNLTTPSGHIYSLPFVDTPGAFGVYPKLWINERWLEAVQLPMPSTVDELFDVLLAFKEKDPNQNGQPDEIPMSFHLVPGSGVPDIQSFLFSAFGFTGPVTVDDSIVRFAPFEPEYRSYLAFMNRLYAAGLIDKEGYSQTVQQKNAKGNNSTLGIFSAGGAFQVVGNELDKNYNLLPPLVSEANKQPFSIRGNNLIRGTFAITSSNAYPEATIRWVDHLYSKEGAILAAQGIEGKHFEYVDNGQGLKALIPEGENPAQFRGTISPNAGTFIPRIHEPVQKLNQYKIEETNPLNHHIAVESKLKLEPIARDAFPLTYFTLEEQQRLKVLEVDITSYVNEMSAKFIVGDTSLDQWDAYISTLEKMNVQEYVDIYQQAYDRWNQGG
ncbi:extracellular solute-binding protein [Paenibacillus sp. J5C_2022]|uniref:extracellular solute-binding protein n=1 Tax=Paenibacillus sp. J5C2022 TaxID=2977129 RepID=UPI0021CE0718|nr:extracellular solute-binding protein [Paenibacillus sp. J5C2022]MCU6709125.1 extracellular solute-binding protein [Paenibacillus sp. J5C2022]